MKNTPKRKHQNMKKQARINHLICPCLVLALALVWSPAPLQSAEHAEGKEMKMESRMMEKCEEMKKEKQEMQAKMKAQDAELTAAVATMNRAAQDKKVNLLADIVTQLVEQRAAMNVQKAEMQEKMMMHMMEHMEMGKESMAKCPMMKEMKGMDGKSEGDHKEHHQKQE